MAQVIRPAAFVTEEEIEEVLGAPEMPQMPPQADVGMALINGAQAVVGKVQEHQTTIRNIALVVGGAYFLVKGPPLLAQSFAQTMHFLREGWHGRGYEDRWLEEAKNNRD